MNTDPSDIVVFISDGLSRIQKSFVGIGFSDKGDEFFTADIFEQMLQEGVDFLCADSSLSVEARKAAWNFQTNQMMSYIERSVVALDSKEILLQMMNNISDKNFIHHCTKRAELIEKVMHNTLNKEASPKTQPTSVGQKSSM